MHQNERLSLRETESARLIEELMKLAHDHIGKILPKSKIGIAFNYLIGLKPYLKNYLNEPMARMDNNVGKRALRPVAAGRKNWLLLEAKLPSKTQPSCSLLLQPVEH